MNAEPRPESVVAEAEAIARGALRHVANELYAEEMAKPPPEGYPGDGFLGCGISPCCSHKPCLRS